MCDVFLTNLPLLFEFQPKRYPSDRSGTAVLVSLHTGQAAKWATAILRSKMDTRYSYPEFNPAAQD